MRATSISSIRSIAINTGDETAHEDWHPGPGWRLDWSDEFDADTLDTSVWNRQIEPAGRFNDEWQRYTGSDTNAYVSEGRLVIEAVHESVLHGMDCYSSARLNTAGNRTFRDGKLAAKLRLPHGEGIWPAFWLLGSDCDENGGTTPWPACGEIDVMELYGSRDPGAVEANLHYADDNGEHTCLEPPQYRLAHGRFADDFHIFELDRDETSIAWSVDGNEYARIDVSGDSFEVFRQPFFILLNIAVGGVTAGRPDATTAWPQRMEVEWVRHYRCV